MYMNSSFQIYFNKSIYFKLKLCNIDGVRILLILICKYNNYDKGDIYAKKVKEKGGDVNSMFKGCTKASNYSSLPGYLIRWS